MRTRSLFALLLFAATACSNAGQSLGFPALSQGGIGVKVYLDRDGSQSITTFDTTFAGERVVLLAAAGSDTVRVGTADSAGDVIFDSLPVGSYRLALDRHSLGDSIGVVAGDTGLVRLTADSGVATRLIRVGFTEVSIAQARTLAAGKRVILRGVVVSPMQFSHDSSTYMADSSGSIRVTNSTHRPGRNGDNIGDSVLVLGTTGTALGQPVLADGIVGDVALGTAPVPVHVTVAQARTANGGKLDAALVVITAGTKIVDTLPMPPDFVVRIADPNDSTQTTDVLIDELFQLSHSVWAIGLTFNVEGVLVPRGDGTWFVKPRSGVDITLTN
ncbi:MAG TPA: hypothetical protein VHW65_06855 [Gemmatimonadales bacterium]|jgi:hypothetical protein|nr:hypothetical protein [Gemmatimonadales bacterium]